MKSPPNRMLKNCVFQHPAKTPGNWSRELWAWQFLRRNPEYQRDYADFITRWRALEADYGKAPNRDFPRWKNDPRAWVREGDPDLGCDNAAGACVIENGKIMIECWMGAKWGFYKFPQDPEKENPAYPGELLWREQELHPALLPPGESASTQPELAAVQFDLRLSFSDQWEEARKLLAAERRARGKNGELRPRIRDNISLWQCCLDYLDGKLDIAQCEKSGFTPKLIAEEATRLIKGGYRTIIMMKE